MYEISVAGKFMAVHQLRLADGTLEVPHEHEWHVLVTFAGPTLDSRWTTNGFRGYPTTLERFSGNPI